MTGIGLAEKPKRERHLLRPRQVAAMTEEVQRIDEMLRLPASQLVGVDIPAAIRQRNNMKAQLEAQTPRPFAPEERDEAMKLEAQLREELTLGMPTQAEMRRNPPGAVDKHRVWEKQNKRKIIAWKNHRLRMHVTGMLGSMPEDATDVSNLEMYRPRGGSHELSMDFAQILAARDFHFPPIIASQNHAPDPDRERWEAETNQILAEQAQSGSERAHAALVSRVGADMAKAMVAAVAEMRKEQGTPPALPVGKKSPKLDG